MALFPEVLKQLRVTHQLTQKELADILGVSQSAVFYWENGKRDVSLDMLEKIAKYFDVPIDTFFNGVFYDEPHTIAAHHEGEEWTDEELAEIEEFKRFVLSKRKDLKCPVKRLED